LLLIAERGRDGQSYNVGGNCQRSNVFVVRAICALVDELSPDCTGRRERLSGSAPIGPAITFDMQSTLEKSARSSDGIRKRPSKMGCEKLSNGISPIASGGSGSALMCTAANVSGWGVMARINATADPNERKKC
jgi:hypothetical protein